MKLDTRDFSSGTESMGAEVSDAGEEGKGVVADMEGGVSSAKSKLIPHPNTKPQSEEKQLEMMMA